MYLNAVNYHSICMSDFLLPITPASLPRFLKLIMSRPAAVSPIMFEKSVNEEARVV